MRSFLRTIILLALTVAFNISGTTPALAAEDLLCSTFPIYLFTRNITEGSDTFKVDLMVDSSKGCPHDYNPTPAELEKLSKAKVLVINGLGLEGFLDQALRVTRPDLAVVDASGGERAVRAFLADPPVEMASTIIISKETARKLSQGHGHGADADELNPHLFAAPRTAAVLVANITLGLSEIDPPKADLYRNNGARLIRQLLNLSGATVPGLRANLGGAKVITSHGIFDYLAQDWGLNIVAKIEEEDGAEPSAARLTELARLARQEGVKAVLVDPTGNLPLARTLAAEVKIPAAVIDPVAGGPVDAPLDYYEKVMLTNITVLLKLFTRSAPPDQPKGQEPPQK